jgi:tRNA-Thr(GGU) m(6)t(6)A37 methyltransferase TsaA
MDRECAGGGGTVTYRVIGRIRTPFTCQEDAPLQSRHSDAAGTIELGPAYVSGLKDLEGFSHIILVYHFHRADCVQLTARPLSSTGEAEHGIFAVRHFNRPNPIGISVVRLVEITGTTLQVIGADMLDGTPLLDIKPWIPNFDRFDDATGGWVTEENLRIIKDRGSRPVG